MRNGLAPDGRQRYVRTLKPGLMIRHRACMRRFVFALARSWQMPCALSINLIRHDFP
ncbi:MAG: hypothetical protein M3R15_00815 [Acidobacteriota bacterium]|nr:hypothetical protein [Acidobacteriota bacterium]